MFVRFSISLSGWDLGLLVSCISPLWFLNHPVVARQRLWVGPFRLFLLMMTEGFFPCDRGRFRRVGFDTVAFCVFFEH